MTLWNLGIIARQRILLFPFFFLLLEVVPRQSGELAGLRQRLRRTKSFLADGEALATAALRRSGLRGPPTTTRV
jgi:hypothetical protein